MLKKVSEQVDTRPVDEVSSQTDDWIQCANCDQAITRSRWAIPVNGDHHHTVFNPAGQLFHVRCFSAAPGVNERGDPTDHFTWFRGYTWRFAHCQGCGQHIGWGYQSAEMEGATAFFGLIATKLRNAPSQS